MCRRYRQIPRFGTDTIRRFVANASEMKKLGARDFEDLLQCAIPAFEGLFKLPENDVHEVRILKLLYRMAEWHAFAKLRMHTDPTLEHTETLTSEVGRLLRDFKRTTCAEFNTRELPRETEARGRREQAAASVGASGKTQNAASATTPQASTKEKTFNLNTYKLHAMGEYTHTIWLFGPIELYSSQYVRLCCSH